MIVAELRDAKQGYRVRSPLTGGLGGVPPTEVKQSESDTQPPLRPRERLP